MRLKNSEIVRKIIGDESRKARLTGLEMTLKELSDQTGINLKTLSGFENARSSNFYIFYIYYILLDDDNRIKMLKNILERIE